MLELHQVAQRVEDLDRAVEFYTKVLGGELMARFEPPGLAFVRMGGARLLLEKAAPAALIYLRVADTKAATEELRQAGVAIDTEPHCIHVDTDGVFGEPGEEEWMAFIKDSEGNLVGLASRHTASRHTASRHTASRQAPD
jgi:catechol 2,3-dioxygenase-like lactoylglutathione lyase family enzyme